MISFIHLSDIHFTKHSNDYYDVDEDLRNEIKLDIIHYFPSNVNPQGILICGDIAYSGQSKEYDIASQFINEICDIIKIPKFSVFCVPGNHDVNQNIPEQHPVVKSLQDNLAKCSTLCDYNDALSKVFRSDISSIDFQPKCNKIHKKLRSNSAGERKPRRFLGRLLIRSTTA